MPAPTINPKTIQSQDPCDAKYPTAPPVNAPTIANREEAFVLALAVVSVES